MLRKFQRPFLTQKGSEQKPFFVGDDEMANELSIDIFRFLLQYLLQQGTFQSISSEILVHFEIFSQKIFPDFFIKTIY